MTSSTRMTNLIMTHGITHGDDVIVVGEHVTVQVFPFISVNQQYIALNE
jgi:hypothetical protein